LQAEVVPDSVHAAVVAIALPAPESDEVTPFCPDHA
jgi:hypothetical protein